MGQKVHPYGFRLGYTKPWKSRWFVEKDYDKLLLEDVKLKNELKDKLKSAGVSSIEVERPGNKLRVIIKTARPGIIIGRKGAEIDKLKQDVQKRTSREVYIDIQEVHKPELDAQLVSESIALQLEKRVGFRRAMRKAVDSALRFGCKGIKVRVSGRLNGNEIARSEWYLQGRLPLHTLRADIDYGFTEARTTYGVIGVKCWVYKGEILPTKKREPQQAHFGGRSSLRLTQKTRVGGELTRADFMLMPKKVKYRKQQRGRMCGKAWRGSQLAFGDFGLKVLEPGWITDRQIEASRVAMTRFVKRGGKIWIRLFPDKPVTKKPAETRMGKGKGAPDHWVAVVRPGKILFEMEGVSVQDASEAMRLASHKLPLRTSFVKRQSAAH